MKRRDLVRGAMVAGAVGVGGLLYHLRGGGGGGVHTEGGTLVAAMPGEPATLVSAFDSTMTNCMIGAKIMEGLVTYDPDLNPVPALAQSWTVSEDGRIIHFHLRRGVKWHDGHDFTSDDVAWTLLHVWRELHPFGRAVYHNVEHVETPDAHTVIIYLSAPARYLFSYINSYGSQILPRHIYDGRDVLSNPTNLAPIGTGPFRFVEWQRGSHVRLVKNPAYWRPHRPHLDGIVYRFMPDPAARAAALQSGEVDFAPGNAIPWLSLRRFEDSRRFTLNTIDGRFLATIIMVLVNVRHGPLADVRVRRAIMHAIDKQAFIRLVLRGHGKAATGPVPSSVRKYYSDDVPHYPFDPAQAIALLDQAGYHPDAEGIRLRLTLDSGQVEAARQAEFIRQSLARIGIRLTLRQQDMVSFLRQIFTLQDYDLALTGLHMLPDPTLGVQRLYWSKNIRKGAIWSNGSGYANPVLDQVMEAAQSEGNEEKRKALILRWQQIVQEDLPVLNLVESPWISVANARLHRPTLQGDGLFDTLGDAFFAA